MKTFDFKIKNKDGVVLSTTIVGVRAKLAFSDMLASRGIAFDVSRYADTAYEMKGLTRALESVQSWTR